MTDGLNEEQLRDRNHRIDAALQLQQIPDHELIGTAPGPQDDRYPMEMVRRLKAAIGDMTARLEAFKASSDRLARRVVALNGILVALTLVLIALTIVLIVRS
jgi:hypothetical protein